MSHPDATIASFQKRSSANQPVPLHPADIKALLTAITTFQDGNLQRRLVYANQHKISIQLTGTEMASLLTEIRVNGGS